MRIIIVLGKYGGFCNRLFQSLHYHAHSIEEGATFFNPTLIGLLKFDNYFFYLLDNLNNLFLKFLMKPLKFLFKNNELCFYFNKNNYIKIVKGWEFRKYQLTLKHHEKLKILYAFKSKNLLKKSISLINYLTTLKNRGKFIVGLHIRRKDYKEWNNGKYYFDDEYYKYVIKNLKNKLTKENKEPFFIVVSDEKINSKLGMDFFSLGSWKEDQILLQFCDLIVGPPSTFTMWASYISKVPLIQLNPNKKTFNLNGKVCEG